MDRKNLRPAMPAENGEAARTDGPDAVALAFVTGTAVPSAELRRRVLTSVEDVLRDRQPLTHAPIHRRPRAMLGGATALALSLAFLPVVTAVMAAGFNVSGRVAPRLVKLSPSLAERARAAGVTLDLLPPLSNPSTNPAAINAATTAAATAPADETAAGSFVLRSIDSRNLLQGAL